MVPVIGSTRYGLLSRTENMLRLRLWFLIVSAALLAGGVGCKKSNSKSAEQQPAAEQSAPPAEAAAPAPEANTPPPQASAAQPVAPTAPVAVPATVTLRGAPEVMAALNRKDYGAAVVLLTGIKAGVKDDQRLEYNELMRTVRGALFEAKANNQSAKMAFEALRQIEAGR
jgi:hypothetical protein